MATLLECQTIYSLEDVYNMIEVAAVNNHNRKIMQDFMDKNRK